MSPIEALKRIANYEIRSDRRHKGMVGIEEVERLKRYARLGLESEIEGGKFVAFLEVSGTQQIEIDAESLEEAWEKAKKKTLDLETEMPSMEFRVTYVGEKGKSWK